jgi:hypothetical protein
MYSGKIAVPPGGGGIRKMVSIPHINEIKEFWSNIWSNEVQFNNQAEWIPHLENEIPDSNNSHHIQISLEILANGSLFNEFVCNLGFFLA